MKNYKNYNYACLTDLNIVSKYVTEYIRARFILGRFKVILLVLLNKKNQPT